MEYVDKLKITKKLKQVNAVLNLISLSDNEESADNINYANWMLCEMLDDVIKELEQPV